MCSGNLIGIRGDVNAGKEIEPWTNGGKSFFVGHSIQEAAFEQYFQVSVSFANNPISVKDATLDFEAPHPRLNHQLRHSVRITPQAADLFLCLLPNWSRRIVICHPSFEIGEKSARLCIAFDGVHRDIDIEIHPLSLIARTSTRQFHL